MGSQREEAAVEPRAPRRVAFLIGYIYIYPADICDGSRQGGRRGVLVRLGTAKTGGVGIAYTQKVHQVSRRYGGVAFFLPPSCLLAARGRADAYLGLAAVIDAPALYCWLNDAIEDLELQCYCHGRRRNHSGRCIVGDTNPLLLDVTPGGFAVSHVVLPMAWPSEPNPEFFNLHALSTTPGGNA